MIASFFAGVGCLSLSLSAGTDQPAMRGDETRSREAKVTGLTAGIRINNMAAGPYQSPSSVIDFTTRYSGDLNTVVGHRMRQLGVPENMIGIRNYPGVAEGPFTRFGSTQIGGNVNPNLVPGRLAGIALDHGIFDAAHPTMNKVPFWASATLRDRKDTAIVHEYIEATLQPPSNLRGRTAVSWLHKEAIRRAPDIRMPITPGAKRILTQYRQAEGLAQ